MKLFAQIILCALALVQLAVADNVRMNRAALPRLESRLVVLYGNLNLNTRNSMHKFIPGVHPYQMTSPRWIQQKNRSLITKIIHSTVEVWTTLARTIMAKWAPALIKSLPEIQHPTAFRFTATVPTPHRLTVAIYHQLQPTRLRLHLTPPRLILTPLRLLLTPLRLIPLRHQPTPSRMLTYRQLAMKNSKKLIHQLVLLRRKSW